MTDPIRAALVRLHQYSYMFPMHDTDEIVAAALTALDNSDGPALPEDYIDPEHEGEDRALLEAYYVACNSEGGTADEITLRGLRAVLALPRSATPPTPAAGEAGELVAWLLEEAMQAANSDASHSAGMLTWAAQVVGEHADLASDEPTVPAPPASEEVEELVAWLHGQDGGIGRRAIYSRIAALLEQQQERISELDNEVETQRMKVVCCGMVAVSDTPSSAAKNRACHPDYWSEAAEDVARQIDELMRLREVLKPVPVGDPPKPEDCDAEEGRCWWFVPASMLPNGICPYWCLAPAESPRSWFTHWLPAHALPIPQEEVE